MGKEMPTTIFLTRHGKTAANLENRFAGRSSEPLPPPGREQMAGVADRLKGMPISAIYTGPLARTSQSAAIIGAATGAPVQVRDPFTEISIPHWDGLTKEEIRANFGAEYPTWLGTPDKFNLPGCETLGQVQERAALAIERIFRERAGETVVVVSHLIVIRCLVLYYCGRPLRAFRDIKIDNGTLTRLVRGGGSRVEVLLDV
jgi:broad specificity phosphatase PhoE